MIESPALTKSPQAGIFLVAITIVAAMGGLLFGFDMAVISGVLPFVKQQFTLSAAAEGWFVSSALMGCIFGVSFSGSLSDKFGRKIMLMLAAILFTVSATGAASAPSFTILVIARIIGGTGVGIASIVAPLYISEIAPAGIRGRLVTFYQLAITAGILCAYVTNAGLVNTSLTQNSAQGSLVNFLFVKEVWRSMMGIGVIPSLLFLIGLLFVPESPRWLAQNNREDEGLFILIKINRSDAALQHEIDSVKTSTGQKRGSLKDLFAPALKKPLILGLLLPLFSQFCGINAVIYYGPQILSNSGISIGNALLSQVLFGLANFIFTLIAIWKVDKMGRRPLYLFGSMGASIALFFTAWCFYSHHTANVALVIGIIFFIACFSFSMGPLKFVVASEIFPTRIRGRALALSIMTMWIADTIVGQLTPILLKSIGPAFTFACFALCCFISFVTVYKLLPETKGRSLEDVQEIWGG
jgi:SP family arabinose:H+ symporter-like MFS transporter